MISAGKISIYYHSLRHLKPMMIYWRLHRTLKGMFFPSIRPGKLDSSAEVMGEVPDVEMPYYCESIDLTRRSFTFLNSTVELPEDTAGWSVALSGQPLLWRFHFCYHDWLCALLRGPGQDRLLGEVLDFAASWDDVFPCTAHDARECSWHPYVISIRIESWIRLVGRARHAGIGIDDVRLKKLVRGVERMTRVLLHNLEYGTMANHLMRNIKALVLAGVTLRGSIGARALKKSMRLLAREIPEQILADGCHFERSPMYHVSVLNDVQDMIDYLAATGHDVPSYLAEAQCRMTEFLERIQCPDGDIPFFNDSTCSFFLHASDVLARGRSMDAVHEAAGGQACGEASGLEVYRCGGLYTAFDAGDIGPDYQPGHAHCDTLSFETSLHGRRVIIDTGVFHYRECEERQYCRSTSAHNTVVINGWEQSEVWQSFRVGRRAHALAAAADRSDGLTLLRGAHDGYRRFNPAFTHERCLAIHEDEWMLVIDWIHGGGGVEIESFLHFHPDVAVTLVDMGCICETETDTFSIHTPDGLKPDIESTEYYPRFGEKKPRRTLRMSGKCEAPLLAVTGIVFEGALPEIRLDSAGGKVQISCSDRVVEIEPMLPSCTSCIFVNTFPLKWELRQRDAMK
jgi:uncharacterized heparinase superfamily protein